MKVILTLPVEIALRALGDDDRCRVTAWFAQLGNWESDEFLRKNSRKLPDENNVYVLKTTTDLRIFFRPDRKKREITILDIASKGTIDAFAPLAK